MDKLVETLAKFLLPTEKGVISITGAGGKTSSLVALGKYFRERGKSVLLTTTTKIQSPRLFFYDADYIFTSREEALSYEAEKGKTAFYAEKHIMDPKKYISPEHDILSILIKRFDVVIIEADGAKMLPVKYHTDRDPVILDETTATLAVLGASAWGECIDNVCFGFDSQARVDEKFLNFLLCDPQGIYKKAQGNTMLFINQGDEKQIPLESLDSKYPVILGSVKEDRIYERKGL